MHLALNPDQTPSDKQYRVADPTLTNPSWHQNWHVVPNSLVFLVQLTIILLSTSNFLHLMTKIWVNSNAYMPLYFSMLDILSQNVSVPDHVGKKLFGDLSFKEHCRNVEPYILKPCLQWMPHALPIVFEQKPPIKKPFVGDLSGSHWLCCFI